MSVLFQHYRHGWNHLFFVSDQQMLRTQTQQVRKVAAIYPYINSPPLLFSLSMGLAILATPETSEVSLAETSYQ